MQPAPRSLAPVSPLAAANICVACPLKPPAAVDLGNAPRALSARLAFRRSFCSLRSLCRRRVLQPIGREAARRVGDLLIGQNDWIAERERKVILLRDRL